MFHIPAHKNVEHPAGQVSPGRIAQEDMALHQAIERAVSASTRTLWGMPVIHIPTVQE
jgi:hypothetical protein